MCGEAVINESELEKFETSIAEAVNKSNALDELASWLRSQPCIAFVKLEAYLIKTFPPRREFTIGIRMEGGAIQQKILTIVILEEGQFEFHQIREPS